MDLEERVKKLEESKQGGLKFFVQYLLSPLLVVLVGLVFNWQVEASKKEVQQLQLAYSMLNTLFSDDEIKTLATKRLMDEVLTRADLKKAIGVMVDDYLSKKFHNAITRGNVEEAKQLSEAAALIGGKSGDAITNMIKASPAHTKALADYDTARKLELSGFEAILEGDAKSAIAQFQQVQQIYPRFHSVDEVLQLIRQNKAQFTQPEVQGKVCREIAEKYSWKLPAQLIARLKEKR